MLEKRISIITFWQIRVNAHGFCYQQPRAVRFVDFVSEDICRDLPPPGAAIFIFRP